MKTKNDAKHEGSKSPKDYSAKSEYRSKGKKPQRGGKRC